MSKVIRSEQNLYLKIRRDICRKIYSGTYKDGDRIPPERTLAEEFGVSRVTVRTALSLLEEDGIVSRVQGSGTRIDMHYGAREQSDKDIITIVATAHNEWFSRFMDAFAARAEREDQLVLFKPKPAGTSLADCLFQLYEKGLRNVVLWKEGMELEDDQLRVLRGLGMNMVLFDTEEREAFADSVSLDNADAVRSLVDRLQKDGCRELCYVGWDRMDIGSLFVRESTFREIVPDGKIVHIPYTYHNQLDHIPEGLTEVCIRSIAQCDGVIYAVGELGMLFEGTMRGRGIAHRAGMVGEMLGAREMGIYRIAQDFTAIADQTLWCFDQQKSAASGWHPEAYRIKGIWMGP